MEKTLQVMCNDYSGANPGERPMAPKVTSPRSSRRIVMIGTAPHGPGGIAAVVRVYLSHGLFERWPVTFIHSHVAGSHWQKIGAFASGFARFARMLLRHDVALLHVHVSSGPSFWRKSSFAALAFVFRVPVIAHVHGGGFEEFYRRRCGPLRRRIVRFVLERSARVIALSPVWAEKLRHIAPRARLVCVANPVSAAGAQPRQLAGRSVLFLGKLSREKGVFDLLEATALLRRRLPDIRLILAGNGDVEAARAHARALGLEETVILPGWVSGAAKEELIRSSSVFVLPSYFECMPMSLLEAMAAGIPCVVTNVGGIPDILRNGVEGRVVEPGNVQALAQAVEQLLTDPQIYAGMSAASLARFGVEFHADVVMPRLERVYAEFGVGPTRGLAQSA